MNPTLPQVSIIVRTHQRPTLLERTLWSLCHQKYQDFEVIVVEDGPPLSQNRVGSFDSLNINYIFTGEQVGRARAGNVGLSNSRGIYLNFLDDDDLLMPDHVLKMVGILANNKNIDAVHAASIEKKMDILSLDPLEVSVFGPKVKYNRPFNHERIFFENMFPIQAVMFRRTLFEQYGGMDESLELLEDWDLWIKYSMYAKFRYVDTTTSIYHIPKDQKMLRDRHNELKRYERVIAKKYRDYIQDKGYSPASKVTKLIEKWQGLF